MTEKIAEIYDYSFKIFLKNENLKLVDVPSDGHCLLHAILKNTVEYSYSDLLLKIINEYNLNGNEWNAYNFCSKTSYNDLMKSFLFDKKWNVGAMDVLPNIISKILEKKILIFKVDSEYSFNSYSQTYDPDFIHTIKIALFNNHYLALTEDEKMSQSNNDDEDENISSTFLDKSIKQMPLIKNIEIEQFMKQQEKVKLYALSVSSFNKTIQILNKNISLARQEQEEIQNHHKQLFLEVAQKYDHLIPNFQMIDIDIECRDFSSLPEQFNLFKLMDNDQPISKINKRLFNHIDSSDIDDQEMVQAEINQSLKKKYKTTKE